MKDSEVLSRISKGDESALEFLYKKHYRMMARAIKSNSGTEEEAKDIYQEALIVFWQKVASGELVLTSKISTYLYSVCINLWRKELDRKSRTLDSSEEMYEEINIDRKEQIKIIREAVNRLGRTCRDILSYHYFDGLSMIDIAKKMGYANPETAKTKKYKCKKRLDNFIKSKYQAGDFLD